MPTLKILKGLPGSGKSTIANELAKKGWKVVEKDRLRKTISGEKAIIQARDDLIRSWLMKGKNVVCSDTNLHPKHIPHLASIGKECHADIEVELVDVPLDECIRRDSLRECPIGKRAIHSMNTRYLKSEVL